MSNDLTRLNKLLQDFTKTELFKATGKHGIKVQINFNNSKNIPSYDITIFKNSIIIKTYELTSQSPDTFCGELTTWYSQCKNDLYTEGVIKCNCDSHQLFWKGHTCGAINSNLTISNLPIKEVA